MGRDKIAHAVFSAVAAWCVGCIGFAALGGHAWQWAWLVLIPGAVRELAQLGTTRSGWLLIWASRSAWTRWMIGTPEWGDMAANTIGTFAGSAILQAVLS
jgi:hypothetical protein